MSTCLFCNNQTFSNSAFEDTIFNNKTFQYIECDKCSLIQVDPLPNLQDYEAMYTMDYYQYETIQPSSMYDKLFSDIKNAGNFKTFLDYGCGAGKYLANALAKGYEVTGTDFGSELIENLKKSYPGGKFLEISDFNNTHEKYDIIFVSNVFEHLTNPKEVLLNLVNRLNPEGILVSDGPIENNFTVAGIFRKTMFRFRKSILKTTVTHSPKHIFYSNYTNQLSFFSTSNLQTIKFDVNEGTWPFPANFSSAQGLKGKMFFLIGITSVILGKMIPKNGNTFYYIGRKVN